MSSVLASSGVSFRPRPPTTTFIATGGGPSGSGTITRIRNSGMFTRIQRLSTGGGGSARIRSIVMTMARTGVANGLAQPRRGVLRDDAVGRREVLPLLQPLHAAHQRGVVERVGLDRRHRQCVGQVAQRHEQPAQGRRAGVPLSRCEPRGKRGSVVSALSAASMR